MDEIALLYLEGTDGVTNNCEYDSNRSLRIESEYACGNFFERQKDRTERERERIQGNQTTCIIKIFKD